MSGTKSWFEVVLMPLVVAAVGVIGTYLITEQQAKDASAKAEAERESAIELARADREMKAIEIFTQHFLEGTPEQRGQALRLLGMVNPELGKRVSEEVSSWDSEPESIQAAAADVTRKSVESRSLAARVYIHIQREDDRQVAVKITDILKADGFNVPGTELVANTGPRTSQLRYFKRSEDSGARVIAAQLKAKSIDIKLVYVPGYETSVSIRPNHFEIWLAPGGA